MSKQHQAYNLICLKSATGAKKRYPLGQSRIENYQQLPFTSIDSIDDQIAQKGAKWLIRNYSQRIRKYQEKYDFIPKAVKKVNSKANSPKELANSDIKRVKFEDAQEANSVQKSISKKKEKEIKNFLVAELNRQEQVKEIKTLDARQRLRQQETERLRKVSNFKKSTS